MASPLSGVPSASQPLSTTSWMVLPVLHESGFGNQFGMLLEHLSLAQLARAPLQLPPFHQPAEHRSEAEPPPPHPSELLNLSSLNSPCSAVSAISLEQTHLLPQLDSLLTLAVRREDGTEKAPKWHLARLPLRPRSIELAVVRMLQSKGLEHASVRRTRAKTAHNGSDACV